VRVLVTGVTGFTGGHLARALVARGYRVRGLVRRATDSTPLEASRIEPVIGSLEDTPAVARALTDIDIVYNIAALYRQAGIPNAAYYDVNAKAAGALVEAAAAFKGLADVPVGGVQELHIDILLA